MPEWLSHLLTAVVSSAFVSAVAAAWYKVATTRHRINRESRSDEIGVLRESITELRRDRDAIRDELAGYRRAGDKAIATLKDELTACKVAHQRSQVVEEYLTRENADLSRRVAELEAEVGRLAGGGEGGPSHASC